MENNIEEIVSQRLKDTPTTKGWIVTDSKGNKWNLTPSEPGKFLVTMAITNPASNPYAKKAIKGVEEEKEEKKVAVTEGHNVDCPCSKCFLARKGAKMVTATMKINMTPKDMRRTTLNDTSLWWVNSTKPIYWKHISTRPIHAYGDYCYNDSDVCIWDQIYQTNMFWTITPVPNQPGFYFMNSWLSDGKYCAQQMGGEPATTEYLQRISMWERNAIVDLLPWLWIKIYPSTNTVEYGTGYNWMSFGHNGERIVSDIRLGYSFWPDNGSKMYAYPWYDNATDPCWYSYFEEALP